METFARRWRWISLGLGILFAASAYLAYVVHSLERRAREAEERCVRLEAESASLAGRIDQL